MFTGFLWSCLFHSDHSKLRKAMALENQLNFNSELPVFSFKPYGTLLWFCTQQTTKMSDTLICKLSTKIPLSFGTVGARGKFKTNMADSSVELIEFFRPYKNEVNLYVTNISRRLEKEVVQVRISLCIVICFAAQYGQKRCTTEQ